LLIEICGIYYRWDCTATFSDSFVICGTLFRGQRCVWDWTVMRLLLTFLDFTF